MNEKTKILLFFTLIFLLLPVALAADTLIYLDKEGQKKEVDGKVTLETWEKIEFRAKNKEIIRVTPEKFISLTRSPLSSSLAKAIDQASVALTASELANAGNALKAIKNKKRAPDWQKEYALYHGCKMWLNNGNLLKSLQWATELSSFAGKSRFLFEVFNDCAHLALSLKNKAQLKSVIPKLRPLGSLGESQARYYEAEILYLDKRIKDASRKFRGVYNQLKSQKNPQALQLALDGLSRYLQTLIELEKIDVAKEQLKELEKYALKGDNRSAALYHTVRGDLLQAEKKKADALYAYMHVIVQYPGDYDLHAYALDQGIKLSQELNYKKTSQKLEAERKQRYAK
jgi:hypothetical protein